MSPGHPRHFMQTSAVSQRASIGVAGVASDDLIVGDWLVRPDLDRVVRDGVSLHVRPKLMDLLVYLARNAGRTVPHGELLANIWPNQPFIAGTVLPRCIAELRQTLGDHAADSMVIQTIPKRGYRLIAEVRPAGPTPFRVPHEAGDAGAARPLSRRSGPGPARPAPTHLSLASVPELSAEPTPLPAPHDPRVATWLRRAPLMAARLWRSFRSQTR